MPTFFCKNFYKMLISEHMFHFTTFLIKDREKKWESGQKCQKPRKIAIFRCPLLKKKWAKSGQSGQKSGQKCYMPISGQIFKNKSGQKTRNKCSAKGQKRNKCSASEHQKRNICSPSKHQKSKGKGPVTAQIPYL